MSLGELAALQGLPRTILDRMRTTAQTDGDIGAAIGDAMSINVLMRLLPLAFESAGLLTQACPDIWQGASNIVGVMPDALYIKKGCLKHAV